MGRFFDTESPITRLGNKFADLLVLNFLTIIFSIPVITAGASFTAMHYVALKILRDEESYIIKDFWKSFKENFRQSTILFLIATVIGAWLGIDFYAVIKGGFEIHKYFIFVLGFIAVLYVIWVKWLFVVQSRYQNTIKGTIKNAMLIGGSRLLNSVVMIILAVFPFFLAYAYPKTVPVVLLFGFSLPALLEAMLYGRVFDRIEGKDQESEEAEH